MSWFFNRLNSGNYLGSAPTGFGTEYDRLFAANPYRNLTYDKPFWQNFASAFGFRTDADRWLEDAQVNANEYDAGIYSMMQQNEYNDPSAQAARMRAAGMNPDLLGTGDVAAAASPTEDPNGMSQNVGDEFSQFGQSVMNVLGRAIATYKDFKSLGQIQNVINAGNIENARSMISTIDELINGAFSAEDMSSRESFVTAGNALYSRLFEDEETSWENSLVNSYGFDKRQRKQFYQIARSRLNSMITDENAWKRFAERNKALSSANESKSSPFFADSEETDGAIDVLVKHLSSTGRKILSAKAFNDELAEKLRTGEQNIQEQYLARAKEFELGKAKADSEFATYDENWYSKYLQKTIATTKKAILDELDEKAKSGDGFAKCLLLNWTLDEFAHLNLNAGLNLSFGANFGFNRGISDVTTSILGQ